MPWKCNLCDACHDGEPTCFGCEAPWRAFVASENEFEQRVELTRDQCVVDEKFFFVRGHLVIPIIGNSEPLELAVWASLSEKSFRHMCDRWSDADRENDAPYFGWLSSYLPVYPDTVNLKLSVQSRAPGLVPLFTTEPTDHPLAVDQHQRISVERWHELAHAFLGH